jgi:hypothetical protein
MMQPRMSVRGVVSETSASPQSARGLVDLTGARDFYVVLIAPILREAGLSSDDLLLRMLDDPQLQMAYPVFARDLAAFTEMALREIEGGPA